MFQVPLATSSTCLTSIAFWETVLLYHCRPHLVNRKLIAVSQILFHKIYLHSKSINISEIFTRSAILYEVRKLNKLTKENISEDFIKSIVEYYDPKIMLIESSIKDFKEECNGVFMSVRILMPRNQKLGKSIEVVILDKDKNTATFVAVSENGKAISAPPFPYQIELTVTFNLRINLNNFEDADTTHAEWIAEKLFKKLLKWVENDIEDNKQMHSLSLITVDEYCLTYGNLKTKYGDSLIREWPKKTNTNPQKYVFEDIAIASYLICIWKKYAKDDVKFVDCGCGNGLLVYILNQEGYSGYGIDLRRRPTWDIYPESTKLEKQPLWDQKDAQYHNRFILNKLWDAVPTEMKSTRNLVRSKWKTLRDTFQKEASEMIWRCLHFLRDQFTARKSTGDLPEIELDIVIEDTIESNAEKFKDNNIVNSPSQSKKREKNQTDDIGSALINIEQNKLRILEIQTKNKDEDELFFESQLPHVGTVTPSSLFPNSTWLIGNHSDELTPWIPVISLRSSPHTNFFILPCCPYDFSGQKYNRTNTSISQYSDYLGYIKNVCNMCGFNTEMDKLRIPSTKRTCLVGIRRQVSSEEMDKINSEINTFIDTRLSTCNFKPRCNTEKVKNCTQLDRNLVQKLVFNCISNLLVEENLIKKTNGEHWNKGISLTLSDLSKKLAAEDLGQLKKECGGLQTLLRNHRYLFDIKNGKVSLREPLRLNEDTTKYKEKPCWFLKYHPNGCLFTSEECAYKHIFLNK
ncbi:hypothetical protein NQ314_014076 [Rhamnusium bicolor]|uniref:tRNA (uracil-O(2)-)-methyltransferase n=1 Tax=Rhamnusium bicolor TaxID=1586634 RepID=A0AAV8X486_9CUCU|nr:hypothetical protein NQ314_014076 [Rhamnusium bicolor]